MVRPNKIRNNFLNDNVGQARLTGMPDAELAKPTVSIPTRTKPQIEAFGPTEFNQEPVTSGMPIGPGPGPTTATKYDYNDFVYKSWIESGDDSLLQYLI